MFCHKCGHQVGDEYLFCPKCGTKIVKSNISTNSNQNSKTVVHSYNPSYQNQTQQQQTYQQYQNISNTANSDDTGSVGWGILGFCIPLVGLILFLVWNSTKPKNAKMAGIGALIGFVLVFVIYLIAGASESSYY